MLPSLPVPFIFNASSTVTSPFSTASFNFVFALDVMFSISSIWFTASFIFLFSALFSWIDFIRSLPAWITFCAPVTTAAPAFLAVSVTLCNLDGWSFFSWASLSCLCCSPSCVSVSNSWSVSPAGLNLLSLAPAFVLGAVSFFLVYKNSISWFNCASSWFFFSTNSLYSFSIASTFSCRFSLFFITLEILSICSFFDSSKDFFSCFILDNSTS